MSDQDNASTLASQFKIPCPTEIDREQLVIVAEDQQDMRLIIAHHLNKLGFKNIQQCQNGYDVINFMKENKLSASKKKISVIVSDKEMPVLGGLELLNELRENPELERPPFAITLDNANRERIMLALEHGVDEIMVKPFTLNDIMPKVMSAFRAFHNPKNPEKVYELAKLLYRADKLDQAEKVYQVIANATKKTARPWVGIARICMKRQQYDKVLEVLKEAETRNPNFVHLYSARGETYMAMGKMPEAIECYKKAIELSPLNPLRYEEAAKPLFGLKRYQEGIDLLQIAIKNELNFSSLHHYMSEGYYALKDYKQAIRHIRTALQDNPENVTYLNQLGIALKENKEIDEAMKIYNSIIKLDNDNKAAYYNKAVLLHSTGDVAEAIKTLQRIVKKFPEFKAGAAKLAEFEKDGGGKKPAA
jgi:tetratricopeptide (TPR) repeat protein